MNIGGTMAGAAYQSGAGRSSAGQAKAAVLNSWRHQENYVPDDADSEILAQLYRRWDPFGKDANHYEFQRQWWLNVSYLANLQYVEWDNIQHRIKNPPKPTWRIRAVINRILPMVQRLHAKMAADQADLRASPRSQDQEDTEAALLADQVLTFLKDHLRYNEVRNDVTAWAATCGTGFMKFTWNPRAGKKITRRYSDGRNEVAFEGDIQVEAASPFSIRVPQLRTSVDEMEWIIQAKTRSIEYVQEHWPDKAAYIYPSQSGHRDSWMEDRIPHLVGMRGFSGSLDTESDPNSCLVVECWTRPFANRTATGKMLEWDKGMRAVVCNGVVLEHGGLPNQGDKYVGNPYNELGVGLPFVDYHHIRIPGRFWGMGLPEPLMPIQRLYNEQRSRIMEHNRLFTAGKVMAPKGHGVPSTHFTNRPGEWLEYNPNLPAPQVWTPPPLPETVFKDLEWMVREMQDIAAQQDVTQAKAPASVRSGVAIQLLQEGDNQVMAMPRQRLWASDRRGAQILLTLAQKKYTEQRTLTVSGQGRQYEVKSFTGADLKGHTDVRLFAEANTLDSRAARQQTLMDLIQIGALDPKNPDHLEVIYRALELGDIKDYIYERTLDTKVAERENAVFLEEEMQQLQAPNPAYFEDHQVHIRIHNKARKSGAYRSMPPDIQAAFDQHVAVHEQFLAAEMAAQQEAVASTAGTPGEKGQAPTSGAGTSGGSQKESNGESEGAAQGGGNQGAQGSRKGDSGAGG